MAGGRRSRLDGRAAAALDLGQPDRSGDSLAGEVRAIDAATPIGKPFQQEQLAATPQGSGSARATVPA